MKYGFGIPLLFCTLLFLSCEHAADIHLYVIKGGEANPGSFVKDSTFVEISDALVKAGEIRKDNKRSKIIVHLQEGEYRLDSSLAITPELSHVEIAGAGSGKVFLKGSKRLHLKWKKYTDSVWEAPIEEGVSVQDLFIDGQKQILARYPDYDEKSRHWNGYAADAIDADRIGLWSNPEGGIFHVMHAAEWGGFHYRITGIDANGNAVLEGGHQNNRPGLGPHKEYRMVENIFEELDSPGEWFLDKDTQKLYYWPEKGTDLKNALVEAVHLKGLLEIKGSMDVPVKDFSIRGVTFEHTGRTIFEIYEPLLRSDWTVYRGGAVFIEGTENVEIRDSEFRNLGGHAVFVSNYNKKTIIRGNHIHDCGASGICFVGDPGIVRSPSFQYKEYVPLNEMDTVPGPVNNNFPHECIADNNLIYRIGTLEKQSSGVEISMSKKITVSNNSIYDTPRAGINIGDGTWGGHLIAYNDVFNTVLETGDHGSFNSWGRDRFWHPDRKKMEEIVSEHPEMPFWDAQDTTVIRNNRFRCDHGWDIDLDDGSSNYHIYNNLCLNGGIKLREGFRRIVENNILVNNGFHPHVWFKNSEDIFRKNIVFMAHKDIMLQGWGKEIDHNFFMDQKDIEASRAHKVDKNSSYGDPLFTDPEAGDFTVAENSPVLKLGFKNFPMDSFGVKDKTLKQIAKKPEIPDMWLARRSDENPGDSPGPVHWLETKIKNVKTLAERSAAGLPESSGVLIIIVEPGSPAEKSGLREGDVIVESEGVEIHRIPDLLKSFQTNNWRGKLKLVVFRNQEKKSVEIKF
ncbi:PDZ domain-containing protein [Sinomicrobium weinanense]|uniref:PDZ domain-containing protein n=1 Tax=Sinomicrobium weinanense TaxID=2842200 RepID=A0A926JR16_9FLAO|nr:PDZ domain-containing protein [Sinomicrobium weinanense]MBC9795708.1 PDZ domain-containing protein [Sinomicrobium weinanense]MBU3125271.1 right-handed parallel beta-helix repeat-containing protein [Sinomicrobium weinanense]